MPNVAAAAAQTIHHRGGSVAGAVDAPAATPSSIPTADGRALSGRNATRTLAVTGGKGGVGKSNLSVALGLCAARSGLRVGIMDADFGLAKLHIMLGLSPQADLRDVLAGRLRLADTILDGPGGIRIIPGASGIAEIANLDVEQRQTLLDELEEVSEQFDLLLIDTGAGIAENVLTFVVAADEAVVVTTPEPTALADAFGLVKVAFDRRKDLHFHLLLNNVASPAEGDAAARRLMGVTERFLGLSISYAGRIPTDNLVRAAVRERKPFLAHAPDGPASLAVRPLAAKILALEDISVPAAAHTSLHTQQQRFATSPAAAGSSTGGPTTAGPRPSVMPATAPQSFVQRLSSLIGLGRRG
jgi:flagellar biosynthesis protein FlhG